MKKAYMAIMTFIIVFIILIPFASSWPDGLENAMEHFGVSESTLYHAPLSYGDTFLTSLISALLGMALVGTMAYIYVKLINKKRLAGR